MTKRKPLLVPKALGKMLTRKGPARDAKHLAKVREWGCIVCMARGPSEAHHVRLGLRTMGKRKSDYLTVPLCSVHHSKLHTMNEGDFWIVCNVWPRDWIARFSKEGAAEIAAIDGAAVGKV